MTHAYRDAFARALVVQAARAGWLGRLAREVGLDHLLEDLYDRDAEVELALYRAHHALHVASASPLALDLLTHWGLSPDALAWRLRPSGDWRRWVCGPRPIRAIHFAHRRKGRAGLPADEGHDRCGFLHGGLVVREWSDPAGAVGIRLSPAGLEIGARLGPVHLRTAGGVATLTTGMAVPETLKAACVGRPIEAVFDHPVLRGRGYVIADQFDRTPTAEDPREAWRIEFAAAPVPWRVPWAS